MTQYVVLCLRERRFTKFQKLYYILPDDVNNRLIRATHSDLQVSVYIIHDDILTLESCTNPKSDGSGHVDRINEIVVASDRTYTRFVMDRVSFGPASPYMFGF